MKACVVDDDYTSLILLKEFLEDQGWNVTVFSHPKEFSENDKNLADELQGNENKLLIMDARFGRDTEGLRLGLSTVEKLVASKKIRSDCMVIFVSQFGKETINFSSYKDNLKSNGIECEWLDKPVDFVLLDAKINKLS